LVFKLQSKMSGMLFWDTVYLHEHAKSSDKSINISDSCDTILQERVR